MPVEDQIREQLLNAGPPPSSYDTALSAGTLSGGRMELRRTLTTLR